MNSRFDSNACPRNACRHFSLVQAISPISRISSFSAATDRNAFALKPPHSCPETLHSFTLSLFSLFSHKSENSASLFSTTYTLFFTLCQRVKRYLHSFLLLPHSLPKTGGYTPCPENICGCSAALTLLADAPTKNAVQNGPYRQSPAKRRESQITSRKPRPLPISPFRHFAPPLLAPEKPYPQPYHHMAKRFNLLHTAGVYSLHSGPREAKVMQPTSLKFLGAALAALLFSGVAL